MLISDDGWLVMFQGKDVLVDVAVINDRDPVPAGFTVVDYTHDTSKIHVYSF